MNMGNYKAKVVGCGIGETREGRPVLVCNIKVQVNENQVELMQWYGYLHSEKSLEITKKALAVMGMSVPDFSKLVNNEGLDTNKVFEVTIEVETAQSGANYPKIAWINEIGGNGKFKMLDKNSAITKLQGLGLMSAVDQQMEIPF